MLERIRRAIREPQLSHLVTYNATRGERDLALALDLPLYGPDPRHDHLGTKSGSRELFALAGIPHPLGVEHIRTNHDAVHAIARLRAIKPRLTELVIKLNDGVSGEGNAFIDLAGLPVPGAADELSRIAQRVTALAPTASSVSAGAFLAKLAAHGGIVEERITARELRSPSAQFQVTPAGVVELLSTHDQILGGPSGQSYRGCRFPADPSYAPTIGALAHRAAQRLADIGVIGRFAIDFVVARTADQRWEPFAIELNLRTGGTTHPYQTLAQLVGGTYDPASASFTTASGQPRHYVATDYLEDPRLRALGTDGALVDRATRRPAVRPRATRRNRAPHAQLARRTRPSRHHRDQRQRRQSDRTVRPCPSNADRASRGISTTCPARLRSQQPDSHRARADTRTSAVTPNASRTARNHVAGGSPDHPDAHLTQSSSTAAETPRSGPLPPAALRDKRASGRTPDGHSS